LKQVLGLGGKAGFYWFPEIGMGKDVEFFIQGLRIRKWKMALLLTAKSDKVVRKNRSDY